MSTIALSSYLEKIDEMTDEKYYDKALYHSLFLLRQFPRMVSVYERLGRAFLESGNYLSALDVFLRLRTVHPEYDAYHLPLVELLPIFGENRLTAEECAVIIALNPENSALRNDLSHKVESLGTPINPDLVGFAEFSEGVNFFRQDQFRDACAAYQLAVEESPSALFRSAALNTEFYYGDSDIAVEGMKTFLVEYPFEQEILCSIAVYYADRDLPAFTQYLERLIEIDPYYEHWEIRDNRLFYEPFPIMVSYYEWTGISNARIRIGRQQSSERLISNDIRALPRWIELLPLSKEAEELLSRAKAFSAKTQSNISESSKPQRMEAYRRSSLFSRTISEEQKKPIPANEEHKESVPIAKTAPVATMESAPVTPPVAKPEESEESREMLRKAWKCFVTGDQAMGVAVYKEMAENGISLGSVKKDLEQLVSLFPENKDLKALLLSDLLNNLINKG